MGPRAGVTKPEVPGEAGTTGPPAKTGMGPRLTARARLDGGAPVGSSSMVDQQRAVPGSPTGGAFGPNAWLVDDMYEEYRSDPTSVSQSWQEFFADYTPPRPPGPDGTPAPANGAAALVATNGGPAVATPAPPDGGVPTVAAPGPPVPVAATAPAPPAPAAGSPDDGNPSPVALRGAAARIAANMEASLAVPTATSVRTVPAKLLEVNRAMLNQHLARTTGAKVSFTHLIGYAVVQALQAVPALNASLRRRRSTRRAPPESSATSMSASVWPSTCSTTRRDADLAGARHPAGRQSRLPRLLVAYEDLVRKVHTEKVSAR